MSDSPTKSNIGAMEIKTEKEPEVVKSGQTPNLPATPTATEVVKSGQTPNIPATPTVQASYYNPEKEIDKLYKWLYGIVIVVVIMFFIVLADVIIEKTIIINYGNLSNKYFDRYLEINKSFNNLNSSIKDQKISALEEENDNLILLTNCLKDKKYWQYEECFK